MKTTNNPMSAQTKEEGDTQQEQQPETKKEEPRRIISILKNRQPISQSLNPNPARLFFHFGTGRKFPAYNDPKHHLFHHYYSKNNFY